MFMLLVKIYENSVRSDQALIMDAARVKASPVYPEINNLGFVEKVRALIGDH